MRRTRPNFNCIRDHSQSFFPAEDLTGVTVKAKKRYVCTGHARNRSCREYASRPVRMIRIFLVVGNAALLCNNALGPVVRGVGKGARNPPCRRGFHKRHLPHHRSSAGVRLLSSSPKTAPRAGASRQRVGAARLGEGPREASWHP